MSLEERKRLVPLQLLACNILEALPNTTEADKLHKMTFNLTLQAAVVKTYNELAAQDAAHEKAQGA